MPQALPVDWNEVRTLAVAVGVREAARQFGISEDAAMARSSREGWLKPAETTKSLATAHFEQRRAQLGLHAHVSKASDALKNLGQTSRLSVAVGLSKAARRVEEMDGETVLAESQNIHSTVKSLALVHGWQSGATDVRLRLDVIAAGRRDAPTLEAEVLESDNNPPLALDSESDLGGA